MSGKVRGKKKNQNEKLYELNLGYSLKIPEFPVSGPLVFLLEDKCNNID